MACTRVGDSVRRVVVAAHMSKVAICQIGDGVAVLSMCRGHPRWRRPPPRASRGGQREEEDPEEGRLEEVVEEEEERRAVLATVTTKYLSQSLALHVLATMPPESESGDVEEQVATPQPQHVHSVSLRTHKPCPQELRDACYDNLEASPPHPRLPRAHPRSPGSPASPPPVLASSASAPTLLPATMQPRFAFAPASSAAPLHAATPLPSSTPTAPLTSSIRVSSMRASSAASAPAHRRVLSCRPELKFWTTTSVFGESLSSHRDLKLPPVLISVDQISVAGISVECTQSKYRGGLNAVIQQISYAISAKPASTVMAIGAVMAFLESRDEEHTLHFILLSQGTYPTIASCLLDIPG
ncbi:hypothetical protein DFH09DRAFT_1076805 [Mycena vulgaris]|nr:hypothetical protein DFH09DRAFT_1076805 [Mycena vulgaris]